MKKRLLPDIVSITPTNYDDFVQCERRFLNRHLLGCRLVQELARTLVGGKQLLDLATEFAVLAASFVQISGSARPIRQIQSRQEDLFLGHGWNPQRSRE